MRATERMKWGQFVDWAFLLLVSGLLIRLTDSVSGLEAKFGVMLEKVESGERIKNDHESRIRNLDQRIYLLEGKAK